MLDLITSRPMIRRERLTQWLGVSEGRVSQMLRSLASRWELVERHGSRRAFRYTLSAEGISYITDQGPRRASDDAGRLER